MIPYRNSEPRKGRIMTNLTSQEFNRINRAIDIAAAQGFKMIKIESGDFHEYDLTCIYGDTLEIYKVRVNTFLKSYDCYHRVN
jgi:hypothetical protein